MTKISVVNFMFLSMCHTFDDITSLRLKFIVMFQAKFIEQVGTSQNKKQKKKGLKEDC